VRAWKSMVDKEKFPYYLIGFENVGKPQGEDQSRE
jgi:hypothetical protein